MLYKHDLSLLPSRNTLQLSIVRRSLGSLVHLTSGAHSLIALSASERARLKLLRLDRMEHEVWIPSVERSSVGDSGLYLDKAW